jgi:hypothetical protein
MVARVFIYCENETRGSPSRSMPVAVRTFLEPSKLLAPLQSQCGPVPLDTMQREAQRGFGNLTRGKRR